MSAKRVTITPKPGVGARAQSWVKQGNATAAAVASPARGDVYCARLTIDVTPALRARIKVSAFQRGKTVVELLRELLEREFPAEAGVAP